VASTISVTLVKAETVALTLTDTGGSGTSSNMTVGAGAAAKLAWTSTTISKGTLSGVCYFGCTYTGVGNSAVFRSKVSLTDSSGNPVLNTTGSAISVTVTKSAGTFTGSATVTIANGASESGGGGDGTVAGRISFTTESGSWSTDTLGATVSPNSYTTPTASLSK